MNMTKETGIRTTMKSGDSFLKDYFPSGWNDFFLKECEKDYFSSLDEMVKEKYMSGTVYPPKENIFRAFDLVSPKDIKVVILGQDPYHEKNQANGLAFSVSEGVPLPRSLVNIYKELNLEYGYPIPKRNGLLEAWARQGVFLLNTSLSVDEGKANSHSKLGWGKFTDDVIMYLDSLDQPIVYILWGNYAFSKKDLIHNGKSFIIHAAHPSPLSASRGFFHSDCFMKCNGYLQENNLGMIDWQISD